MNNYLPEGNIKSNRAILMCCYDDKVSEGIATSAVT